MGRAAALGWSRAGEAQAFRSRLGRGDREGFSLYQASRVSDDPSLVLRSTHIRFQSHGS